MAGGDDGVADGSRMPDRDPGRRRFLGVVGATVVAGIAGCAGGDEGAGTTDGSGSTDGGPGEGGTTGDPEDTAGTDAEPTAGGTGGTETHPGTNAEDTDEGGGTDETTTGNDGGGTAADPDDLDLREANVTGVEFEPQDGAYRFSVTLYHDDDGEDGYANWWQVETLAGERLGRRDLLHAHGTREFTRSETVEVPDGETVVAVRGHDQTHGYGGQAAVLDLEAGGVDFVRQGSEPVDLPRQP